MWPPVLRPRGLLHPCIAVGAGDAKEQLDPVLDMPLAKGQRDGRREVVIPDTGKGDRQLPADNWGNGSALDCVCQKCLGMLVSTIQHAELGTHAGGCLSQVR